MQKNQQVGIQAERLVQRHFESKGYILRNSRLRTPFAEVDLVMEGRGEILLIEVKSLSQPDLIAFRIPWRQKGRLSRARAWAENWLECEVRLIFAFVDKTHKIFLFNGGEETL